jgi:osmotically-inducible protein OsmY
MSDDKQLQQAVLDQLKWEPSVNAADIGVTANNGVITLIGYVQTYTEKLAAENAARRVKNVRAIVEELEVRLPFDVNHGDDEIAVAAVHRLNWDTAALADTVKAKVENGWITLTGEVDWHFQKEAAADDLRGLRGVVGISNEIAVKAKPSIAQIHDDIMLALHRSWFDPVNIKVTARGGHVTLTGTVLSWYERDEASYAAWAAPGTTSVENELLVS